MMVDEELSEVEVNHYWRMVAACRYALFVEVLDVPHDPMAADPDDSCQPEARRWGSGSQPKTLRPPFACEARRS